MFKGRVEPPSGAIATTQKYTVIQPAPSLTAGTAGTASTVIAEHRLILSIAVSYVLAGTALLAVLDRPWRLDPAWWLFGGVWLAGSLIWLGWQSLRDPRHFWAAVNPERLWGAVLVAALLIPVQVTFQALKQAIGAVIGFPADPWLHQLDVAIHGGPAWAWFPLTPWFVRTLDWLYMAWFLGLVGFFLWAAWTSHRVLRQRAIIAFLGVWIGAGTIAAAAMPSAGPCYYEAVTGQTPYAELMAGLDQIDATSGLRARFNQRGVWALHANREWGVFAGLSAMPSIHVAVAVLFALIAWQRSVTFGMVLTVYAVTIQIGSVVLGWHYGIDGYVGALMAWGSWRLADRG